MHPWFSWIRWLNPFYYGFEGEPRASGDEGATDTQR